MGIDSESAADPGRVIAHPTDGPVVDDRMLRSAARLRAVADVCLLDTGDEDPFDRWALRATELTGAPIALVSLVDATRSFFKSFRLSDGSAGGDREVPIAMSLCREVVVRDEPLIVSDALLDPRTKGYEAVRAFPVGAYAGLPLRSADGHVLGSFCVVDSVPREWTADQIDALADLAAAVQSELSLRAARHENRRHVALMNVHQRIHVLLLDGAPRATVLAELVAALEQQTNGLRGEIVLADAGAPGAPPCAARWEAPIVGTDGVSYGSIALSSDLAQPALPQDLELLDQAARLAAIVLERAAATRELTERESQTRRILDQAPDAFISMDRGGRVIEWNVQAERMFGWSRDEALGCTVAELIVPPQARRAHERGLARYLQTGEARVLNRAIELDALCKDGREVPVELTIAAVAGRTETAFNAFVRDVSERREQELAVREAEAMFRGAFTDASVGMCLATLDDARWSQVNPALCAMLGRSAEQLVGMSFDEITHPDDVSDTLEGARRLRDGAISVHRSEKRYMHADGHLIWVSLSVSVLRDAEGAPRCFIAQVLDITRRKTSDAALVTSEERFRLMVENVEDYAILMLDPEGYVATWNAGAQRLNGHAAAEIVGRHFSVFFGPDEVAAGEPARELAIAAAEGRLEDEGWRVRKDGTRFWANVVITALRDADGTLRGYGKITRDLTQRRISELQLDRQRTALADAQSIARIGSWSWDPQTETADWSAEMYRIFGRDPADGPGTAEALFAYLHPDDRDRIPGEYARAFGVGDSFELEYRIVAGTGEERSLHALGRRDAAGRLAGTVQDISERKRIEIALVNAEQLLALAFDHSPLGMTLSAPDRGVLRVNQAFADMLGYSVDELIANQHPTRFTHPDDHAADRDHIRALLDDDEHDTQWDKRYIHAGGHSVWARVSLSVLRDPDGSPRHLVSQIEDITERRQREAEERALRDVAELVAAGAEAAVVFSAITGQVRELFEASTSAVVRFDAAASTGEMLGASASDGLDMLGTTFDLDGATATAEVFRSGRPARVEALALNAGDPLRPTVERFGLTGSVAAPIHVAGELWGAVAAAVADERLAFGAELRLERFAHLASLAIANLRTLETLEHRAATDPLTGIANHRTFHDRLRSEVERARRYGRDLSVVLFDLDHFKAINDTHGHQTGDRILTEVAQRLADEARDGELVARIGGEEFAWLIPETGQHSAYVAAERVRRAIETTVFADVGTVTVSAGLCSGEHARDAQELVRHADRALYCAKERGRNVTVVYTPEARDGCTPGRAHAPSQASRRAG